MQFLRGTPKKKKTEPPPHYADDATATMNNLAATEKMAEDSETTDSNSASKKIKDIAYYKEQIKNEKAGKRKLYHSLVKLAEELKRLRTESKALQDQAEYANQTWYEGGIWRAPQLLPGVDQEHPGNVLPQQRTRLRQPVSLSDLFFNLVIVTAFTRVGIAMTNAGRVSGESILYFAVFWTIWSKEASYSTRFDTTDLSAKMITLLNCFAVLFASLSVSSSIETEGANRIMIMSAFCSLLHFVLMSRVFSWYKSAEPNTLDAHVRTYALFNSMMNLVESATWIFGMLFAPQKYRWVVFTAGVLLGLRIPRAFLANDFHAANTKRGVLFILLLGFMLQSIVVVATDFFEYSAPDYEQYSFIGASCLLLFSIKLLYVDDSNVLVTDHALLVNRAAALFFNLGQFTLLFTTTIMGSGLNLLTHSYLAAAAALPGPAKALVCGGFAGVLFSIAFIKSMHLKRVPRQAQQKAMFIGAYVVQLLVTLMIAGVCLSMCFGQGGYLQVLMQNDVELLWILCGFAVFLVGLSMLDEGLELALQDGEDYLVHPFGFWCCIFQPEVDMEEILAAESGSLGKIESGGRLSELSPLLGESVANLRLSTTRFSLADRKSVV